MTMSRKVGSIDVGDGELAMNVQAGEFILGAPGAGAVMYSSRGGHWIELVLDDARLGAGAEGLGWGTSVARWARRSFHKNREIGDLLARIVRGGLSNAVPEPLYFDALVCSLADAFDRYLDSELTRQREVRPLSRNTVDEILYYMDTHVAEPIAIGDLATLAGLSPTRFAKAFRNAAGESPYQTLIRRRLEAARFALMTTSESLAEISLACGFSSQQHLTGLFSSRFGISPGAFRNQMRTT